MFLSWTFCSVSNFTFVVTFDHLKEEREREEGRGGEVGKNGRLELYPPLPPSLPPSPLKKKGQWVNR
jgi:hypothetical protein